MIYLNDSTKELIVPKFVQDEPYRIIFIGQIDGEAHQFPLNNQEPDSINRYIIPVGELMHNLKKGQYDYKVVRYINEGETSDYDGRYKVLSSGIMQRSDYKVVTSSYNFETEIKVYERD